MTDETDKRCGTCRHFGGEDDAFTPWECHFPLPQWIHDVIVLLGADGYAVFAQDGTNCPTWSKRDE